MSHSEKTGMKKKTAPAVPARSMTIDYLKALAILLVVVGHCVQTGSGTDFFVKGLYYDNIVYKLIYSFHMPLFMLISGYLFSVSAGRAEFKAVLVKKLRTLLLPLLAWTLVFELMMLAVRVCTGEAAFSKWLPMSILNGEPLRQMGIDVFRFAVGLAGSVFVMLSFLKLKKLVLPKKELPFFAYIGKSSFGIYIIQMYLFTYWGGYILPMLDGAAKGPGFLLTTAEAMLLLGFCLGLVYLIRRSKPLDRLLLGGR